MGMHEITIQSPNRLYKAPTDYTKIQHIRQSPNILDTAPIPNDLSRDSQYYLTSILFNLINIEYQSSVLFNLNTIKPRYYLIILSVLLISPIPLWGVAYIWGLCPNRPQAKLHYCNNCRCIICLAAPDE